MKIYLIKTPEYEAEDFHLVGEFLGSFVGPLDFIASLYQFPASQFDFLGFSNFHKETGVKKLLFDISMQALLSWDQLFSLCEYYRQTFKIEDTDYVVLLTQRRNELNWFSHTRNRNIFVQTSEWEHYTDYNAKYPVAYQIMENILQSLMELEVSELPNANIHTKPRGCMNDFCQDKAEIILKLRTADICQDCLNLIQIKGIDNRVVDQASQIFEAIRNELLFKQRTDNITAPVPIVVNEKNEIIFPTLGPLEVRLTPLFKTLYIFYLIHREGVRLAELSDYRQELLAIYRKLSVRDNDEVAARSIDDLVNAFGNSFSSKKSKINSALKELLGIPLANYYLIEGEKGEPFKINLPHHLIDIRF